MSFMWTHLSSKGPSARFLGQPFQYSAPFFLIGFIPQLSSTLSISPSFHWILYSHCCCCCRPSLWYCRSGWWWWQMPMSIKLVSNLCQSNLQFKSDSQESQASVVICPIETGGPGYPHWVRVSPSKSKLELENPKSKSDYARSKRQLRPRLYDFPFSVLSVCLWWWWDGSFLSALLSGPAHCSASSSGSWFDWLVGHWTHCALPFAFSCFICIYISCK